VNLIYNFATKFRAGEQ